METKKRFSDLTEEEIQREIDSVTDKDLKEIQNRSAKRFQKLQVSERVSRTIADMERELLILDKPFEIVKR